MRKSIIPLVAAISLSPILLNAQTPTLDEKIDAAIDFAGSQLEEFSKRTGSTRFASYTSTSGIWNEKKSTDWCSGFPAGMMWMMYDLTGEEKWVTYGKDWTDAVQAQVFASDNDTGFQIFCSYGYGLRHASDALSATEQNNYSTQIADASINFALERYNANIGGYRGWQNKRTNINDAVNNPSITANIDDPDTPYFEINIDMMMNMELPAYYGTVGGGDSIHETYTINHVEKTWDHQIREDGSTVHVTAYDVDNGDEIYHRTHQGADPDSTWSRGQAWAIYGYTMMYRYTEMPEMLDSAEICFDYFMQAMATQNAQDGIDIGEFVPYSDFDMPTDRNDGTGLIHPRDTSASAIVASAALELYSMTEDQKYLTAAENILNDLSSEPYLATGSEQSGYESILAYGSEKYWYSTTKGAEMGTSFGDFYFIEAMLRYKSLNEEPSEGTWITDDLFGTVYSYDGAITGQQWLWQWEAESFIYLDEIQETGAWVWYSK